MHDQAPKQDQDIFSERKETLARVLELGEKIGLGEKSAADRLELLSKLDEESFMAALHALHGVAAPDTPQVIQDKQAVLRNPSGEVTKRLANPEDRHLIVKSGLSSIQRIVDMSRSVEGSESAALQRIADVVGYTITETHFYEDGNGRTSRIAAELIRHGVDEPEIIELLGESRDVSRARGGMIMTGYIPKQGVEYKQAMDAIVAEDLPLSSSASDYRKQVWRTVTTPYDSYDS
jgi:hypothetical protein